MSKRVWLITGAGRGMGVDFARAALASGHAVWRPVETASECPRSWEHRATCWR